jgi:general secretion pathway protein F
MAMFSYRASDATGNIIQGTLEAREERQVVAHLQQGGLIPLRINLAEAATRWQERLPLRWGRVPSREIVNLTQELAALLKAGLPLDRSLQALGDASSRHHLFPGTSALILTYKSIG